MLPSARPVARTGLFLSFLSLAACQSYDPLPLNDGPQLTRDPGLLDHAGVDLMAPLDLAGFTRLVLQNNPDLQAGRADRGVAEAQVLQAGLLPNPQLSGNYGALLSGPASFGAWSAGFGQDIKSLITLGAQRNGARLDAQKVDAELLWQEWQAIAKARLLFVDTVEQLKAHDLLQENRTLFAGRAARSRRALAAGDIELATAAPDFTALGDLDKQIADLDRQMLSRQHDVDALLGLAPDVQLRFTDHIDLPPIDPAEAEGLVHRRPDLVALRLGYGSEEEKVRGTILAQFPALVLGGTGGSDTSHILTFGPQITMDLPIFNRNQGNIAIERATRQKLHDEYGNRLTAATGEVAAMLREQTLLRRQMDTVSIALAEAAAIADRADRAFGAGLIDERAYVDLHAAKLAKRQELVALEQQALEQQVAVATLTGAGMPAIVLSAQSEQTAGAE